MHRFTSRHGAHQQPMIISYYDETIDQDVLRVVKQIRKRAGLPEMSIEAPSKASVKNKKSIIQHHSLLPKYNVEVQTDAPHMMGRNHLPVTRRTAKNSKKEFREVIDFVNYEFNEGDLPVVRPKLKLASRKNGAADTRKKNQPIPKPTKEPPHRKKPPRLDISLARMVPDYDSPSKHFQSSDEHPSSALSHDDDDDDDSYTLFPETPQELFPQRPLFMCNAHPQPSFSFNDPANNVTSQRKFSTLAEDDDDESTLYTQSTFEPPIAAGNSFFDRFMDRIFGAIEEMDDTTTIFSARDEDSLIADSYIGEYYRTTSPSAPRLRPPQPAEQPKPSRAPPLATVQRSSQSSVLEDVVGQILSRVSFSTTQRSPVAAYSQDDDEEEASAFVTEISVPITHYYQDDDETSCSSFGPRRMMKPTIIMEKIKQWEKLEAIKNTTDEETLSDTCSWDGSNTLASKSYIFDRYDF